MMSSSEPPFTCKCNNGKIYATIQGLKQHQRRYCKGAPAPETFICNICERVFEKLCGLNQHKRHAHKDEYNAEKANENSRPAFSQYNWTKDEQKQLARIEATLDPTLPRKEIVRILSSNSNRTSNSIIKRRQRESYIQFVREYRESEQTTNNGSDHVSSASLNNSSHNNSFLNNSLLEAIHNIHIDDESEEDKVFSLALTSNRSDRKAVDMYCEHLIHKYNSKRKRI